MLGWFRALLPKEERFFDLFAKHSQAVLKGAEALEEMMRGVKKPPFIVSASASSKTMLTTSPARC